MQSHKMAELGLKARSLQLGNPCLQAPQYLPALSQQKESVSQGHPMPVSCSFSCPRALAEPEMDYRFQSLGPVKADWLIFFFEIHFAFPCFRVRYEGKHIPLEIIILNSTHNVNCAFGYLIVHSGDQKCRMWKPGAMPTSEPFCQMSTPCQQRERSSEPRSLPKVTDFITERSLSGKAGSVQFQSTPICLPSNLSFPLSWLLWACRPAACKGTRCQHEFQ